MTGHRLCDDVTEPLTFDLVALPAVAPTVETGTLAGHTHLMSALVPVLPWTCVSVWALIAAS